MLKKILKLLSIILFIGFIGVFLKGFYHKETINLENEPKENITQNENQKTNESFISNQEVSKEDISQNKSTNKNVDNERQQKKISSKEVKKNKNTTKTNSKNETINTNKSNTETNKEIDKSSSSEKISTSTNVLPKCTNDDHEWITFVSQQRKNGKIIFNSMEEAIAYGEKALNYDYGYWYNNIKLTYKGKKCKRDYYYTYLYVSPDICTKDGKYNSKFNVKPAFDEKNMISVINYLKSLGYDCGNKE